MSKTINIDETLYEKLQSEAEGMNETLKEKIEKILNNYIKREEMLGEIWKDLEVEKVDQKGVILKNMEERKFYDVLVQDKTLFCQQDRSKGCKHTSFVWMQLNDLGIPLPK